MSNRSYKPNGPSITGSLTCRSYPGGYRSAFPQGSHPTYLNFPLRRKNSEILIVYLNAFTLLQLITLQFVCISLQYFSVAFQGRHTCRCRLQPQGKKVGGRKKRFAGCPAGCCSPGWKGHLGALRFTGWIWTGPAGYGSTPPGVSFLQVVAHLFFSLRFWSAERL